MASRVGEKCLLEESRELTEGESSGAGGGGRTKSKTRVAIWICDLKVKRKEVSMSLYQSRDFVEGQESIQRKILFTKHGLNLDALDFRESSVCLDCAWYLSCALTVAISGPGCHAIAEAKRK